jgi:penicillin amidase
MQKREKKVISRLSITIVIVVVFFTLFSVPLTFLGPIAPLGNILFPGTGLWRGPGEVPEQEILYIENLTDSVVVYRDEWGIPHIYASNEDDLGFALGYVHAQDRMFQMDMARRQIRGKLSEVIGELALDEDKFNLAMGMEYWANESLNNAIQLQETGVINYLNGGYRYADGVNYYIDTHQHEYPPEYGILGFKPTYWSMLDSFCLAKYMSKMLTWNYYDLERLLNYNTLGNDSYNELFNAYSPYQIPICPNYGSFTGNESIISNPLDNPPSLPKSSSSVMATISKFLKDVKSIESERTLIEMKESNIVGSNNWVVDGNKSRTGKPLLANDMHLAWASPGIWYEAHLVSKDTGMNIYGFTLAGVQLPLVAHNQYVGWGFTNTGYDVIDWYYYEEINDDNYNYGGTTTPYTKRTYNINVKGREPEEFTVKNTVHGPVLSDFINNKIPPSINNTNIVLATNWTGNRVDEMLRGVYGFNHAKNRAEFNNASKFFSSPAQNIVYGDIYGNIGIRPTGLVPIRENNGTFPYNGSKGEGDWNSFIPFDELPYTENPTQNYLASANQIVAGPNYTNYFLQNEYATGYRARRINEVLNNTENGTVTIELFKDLQLNVKSSAAEAFTPYLINATDNYAGKNSTINDILTQLKNWDYDMHRDLVAPSIYRKWRDLLMDYTFDDEFDAVNAGRKPQYNVLEKIMENGTSHWFDDITTGTIENRTDIIIKALLDTIGFYIEFFGTNDVSTWRWGDLHQLSFPHIAPGMDTFGKGPYEGDGEGFTVTPSSVNLRNPSKINPATGGASERMIIDFNDMSNSLSVIPSGQRGVSNSKHYADQLEDLFLQGKYHQQYFYSKAEDFPQKHIESQILLLPAEECPECVIYLTVFIVVGCVGGVAIIFLAIRAKKKGFSLNLRKTKRLGGDNQK